MLTGLAAGFGGGGTLQMRKKPSLQTWTSGAGGKKCLKAARMKSATCELSDAAESKQNVKLRSRRCSRLEVMPCEGRVTLAE